MKILLILIRSLQAFCDVTLACDGGSIKCHKMVLAASSPYFHKLFMETSCDHPIVFLKVGSRYFLFLYVARYLRELAISGVV
jgi:hypothetical protein